LKLAKVSLERNFARISGKGNSIPPCEPVTFIAKNYISQFYHFSAFFLRYFKDWRSFIAITPRERQDTKMPAGKKATGGGIGVG
jgi:hypothetical protein